MGERKMSETNNEKNPQVEKKDIKTLNKLKMLDGMTAYIIALVLFACAYGFGTDRIGVWAIYIAAFVSITAVFVLCRLTGLKISSVLKFSSPSKAETVGASLALAASLVLTMPLILFSQLIAPNLAVTSFNIYAIVSTNGGVPIVIILVFLIALCENFLFDGFIYSRFKGIKNVFVKCAVISLMAALIRLDLYVVTTVFIMSFAALLIRSATDSMVLPFVIRLVTASFVMAMTNVSATSSELIGDAMGIVQVVGMTLIFLGIALPTLTGSLAIFGKLGKNGKIFGFASGVLAILLVAAGCGVASL